MGHPQQAIILYFLAIVGRVSASYTSPATTLPQASISISSATWGEDVSITCSISPQTPQTLSGTLTLKRNSSEDRIIAKGYATFKIPKVNFRDEGLYWCLFSYHDRSTKASDNLSITDAGKLQPRIFLTYDGREVQSPANAEVTWGHNFVLTCSISCSCHPGNFTLTFSGSSITPTKPAVNYSASFRFSKAAYQHQGKYSCIYVTRRLNFTNAEPLHVIIMFPFMLLIISVSAGIPVMLLVVVLVVCLLRRRRRKLKLPQTQIKIQIPNSYNDGEEDDEDDYVNFQPEQRADEVEEAEMDYEEMQENDDVTHPLQEDDDAYNDDENDYVNIERLQDLDIYGDELSIYQNL